MDTENCHIGEQPFILLLLEEDVGNAVPCNKSIWIIEPFSGKARKTPFLIPNGLSSFHVAAVRSFVSY